MKATLSRDVRQSASARSLVFEVPGWPGHDAGQHVDVRLTAEDGYTAQRTFSLSAPVDDGAVEITVQRVPDGEVSPYLVDEMTTGDAVDVLGPIGRWFVWTPSQPEPVLLIGGGSGVAPLVAMLRAARRSDRASSFRLLYSVRSPADVLFGEDLRADPSGVATLYTREGDESAARPVGRIARSDLNTYGWPVDAQPTIYVCGPTGFVEAVIALLVSAGHDPNRIRAERFGSTG
ncbi:MAG TPA: FAD-binding oxidoreductase [Acidimicrobiales bacterium]|nr:FAD-binding oxidoreductase [Acidimicrobiales bacterium]